MDLHKYWHELYLTVMMSVALGIIIAASFFLRDDFGLVTIAAGVFVSVLGVGFYDQWQAAELAQARVKTRR